MDSQVPHSFFMALGQIVFCFTAWILFAFHDLFHFLPLILDVFGIVGSLERGCIDLPCSGCFMCGLTA